MNALLPGGTDTAMAQQFAESPDKIAFIEGLHPPKRMASPIEIDRPTFYLASDSSRFTTGPVLLVDDGVSIH